VLAVTGKRAKLDSPGNALTWPRVTLPG
jgi:hypothetical protein